MIQIKKKKNGSLGRYIDWNKVPKEYKHPLEINRFLNKYGISKAELRKGANSKTVLMELYSKGFKRKGNQGQQEICGVAVDGIQTIPFRFGVKKAEIDEREDSFEISGKDAFVYLQPWHNIYKGLPGQYHQYRICSPCPIDWCNDTYTEKLLSEINKADISSAYGYQLTNPSLPDLLNYQIVDDFVEPSEEWPFAFYLDSNSMAVYQEGSSLDWENNRFATSASKNIQFKVKNNRTMLFKGKDYGLKEIISKMYLERDIHPENKSYMNLLVGFLDQKDYYKGQIVGWPIRAAIIFRCNQKILSICDDLLDHLCMPVLINTDSVSWTGKYNPSVNTKYLGSFTTEYINCEMIIRSVKCYQIKSGDKTLTRYSGPHTKSYIATLPFGALLEEDCLAEIRELEAKFIYKWDEETFRYINKKGGIFEYEIEEC